MYECKAYLRMHKLRLSGKREVLLCRIREHIEVKNNGAVKYPVSSFVLNCKGDACKGDVVIFEQNIYKRKKGAPRGRGDRGRLCGQRTLCGKRTNAGRIIKESYGTAKQQHTFTIEILWSEGYKPWPPLHPLLIKGRNLYKDKTMRQPWPDEQKRSRVLQEKHARGFIARKSRDVRIHDKEIEKMRRFNRIKENRSKGKEDINQKSSQKPVSTNTVCQRSDEGRIPSLQHGEPGNTMQHHISSKQNPANHLVNQQFPCWQHYNEVLPQEGAMRTSRPESIEHQVPSVQQGEPEKTRQQQILSRPAPAQQIFKHPQQQNNHRPDPAQQMFKPPQEHGNGQQHNLQQGTTKSFSILGQAPGIHLGGPGNARQLQKSPKPTPVRQIMNQAQPPNYQHRNEVILEEAAKKTCRVDSVDHRNGTYHNTDSVKAPCVQHGVSGNAWQQQKSSKPTPIDQIKNLPQSPVHQYQRGVLRQEVTKRTYRVESIAHQNNTYQNTEYHEPAFQPQGAKQQQHKQSDHQRLQPLRPKNQDFSSRNQGEDYHRRRQMTQEQHHTEQRHHWNQYGRRQMAQDQYQPQQIHHQNQQDSWSMNQNHFPHDYQNYQYAQQVPRLKLCRYYQQNLWCPYQENCKFSHGS